MISTKRESDGLAGIFVNMGLYVTPITNSYRPI